MMTMPCPTSLDALSISDEARQFLSFFAGIVRQHPRNRILLYAWIFCAHLLGVSSGELGCLMGCSDRNIRYIVAEVRASQVGEGKTGRPRKVNAAEPPSATCTLGITRYGGLWLLISWILNSNLLPYCHWLSCVGTVGTPLQLVLTLIALAVCGLGRFWALNDLSDRGFALFTGRWTPLRAGQVSAWLREVAPGAVELFYQATRGEEWRLVRDVPPILSNDEHVVGHQGGLEMPQGKVSKCGRTMRAHHLFMTFHLAARRFVGLLVTTTRQKLSHVAAPLLQEMAQARQAAGGDPDVLILEILDRGSYSQDAHRDLLAGHTIGQWDYLAQLRRTAANVAQWDRGLAWGEYELEPYVRGSEWHLPPERRHRLCLARTTTLITGVAQPVPTLLIIDRDKVDDPDPKAKYAAAFACANDLPLWVQADLYPWRQDHELAYRDCIHALGLDAQPKGYHKERPDLPLDHPEQSCMLTTTPLTLHTWVKALAFNRVRDLLDHLPEPAPGWTVVTAARKLIRRTALLEIREHCLWVTFDPFPEAHVLEPYCAWVNAADFAIPWLNNLRLRLAIAEQPLAAGTSSKEVRKLLFGL
ncbi:MAG: hypothetical protein N2508_03575 [Anaerolineae bacterium]|nr:hypothetical protein [Anaerolineae bacterium]